MKRSLGLMLLTVMLVGAGAGPWVKSTSCRWLAWAAEVQSFGTDGSSGQDGRSGRDGRSGTSQSVTANGNPASLNLAGEDGEDGEHGRPGERPWCGSQPRDVRYDLQAADGGDGGDGGSGGRGGDGGSLLVYYADPNALRQLAVDARGGRGGRGGQGGQGVAGCDCDRTDWTVRTCSGTPGAPDYSCRDERFVCRDGDSGYSGSAGNNGADGTPGLLRLVNQLDPLPPETPSVTLALSDLIAQPTNLTRNLWDKRSGAGALLAPGSVVQDEYLAYRGRVEGQVQVIWNAPRPAANFAGEGVNAEIAESGELGLVFPASLWIAGEPARNGSLLTYTVTGAVRASDATRLAWGTSQGSSRDFTVSIVDLGRESDNLTTRFRLTLKTTQDDPRDTHSPRYTTRFDDWVPADLVTRDGDRFVISVGRLPISQQSFRSGTLAQVELTAVRSLGANSAQQTLSWQGRL